MRKILPTYDQLRYYWCIMQGDRDLPCALFLLECDAKDWLEQQETKEVYFIQSPVVNC